MTHKQWLLRNARVHIKRKGDMIEEDHSKLLAKINKLVVTNPEGILPHNRKLLDEDFNALGRASTLDQQLWVAVMKGSIAVTNHRKTRDNVRKQ